MDVELEKQVLRRVKDTEDDVINLTADVAAQTTQISAVNSNVNILIESMREIRHEISEMAKPKWGVIVSAALLFVTVFGSGFAFVVSQRDDDITRLENYQDKVVELQLKEIQNRHSFEIKSLETQYEFQMEQLRQK